MKKERDFVSESTPFFWYPMATPADSLTGRLDLTTPDMAVSLAFSLFLTGSHKYSLDAFNQALA